MAATARELQLLAALKPFADLGNQLNTAGKDAWPDGASAQHLKMDFITAKHFRAAADAINECFQHGTKIHATFLPNTKNLRPCMFQLIGRSFEFEWAGIGGDDEPYPGQSRWVITRKHDSELSNEVKGRWFPFEDLEIES